jgi:c-di-AMP phosphodiesterase-like protein
MLKKVLLSSIALLLIGIVFIGYKVSKVPEIPVHYHANFALFKNGTQIDFSDAKYMHIAPCSDSPIEKPAKNKLDEIHLHNTIGNVVHVHTSGVTWRNLFQSLKFNIDEILSDKAIKIYINEKEVARNALDTQIQKEQRLLITTSTDPKTEFAQVGSDAKEYDDGKKGPESCGATGKRTLKDRITIALQTLLDDNSF